MSTSKSYHHGGLRDALIASALDLVEQSSPDGLALRAVARAAGVSAMAPYRHFADRSALLVAVAEAGFALLEAALRDADADADAEQALTGLGLAYVAFATARPALFRLMFGAAGPRPPGIGEAAFRVLADRVQTLTGPDEAGTAALACWSLVHGLASLTVDGPLSGGPPERTAAVIRSLMRGLRPT